MDERHVIAQRLWIPGPLPGMNEIIAAARRRISKGSMYDRMKAEWTKHIALLAKAARLKPVRSASLLFGWYEKHSRRDPDNIVAGRKFICDALVEAKVLKNDGWDDITGFVDQWFVDPKRQGVEVVINEQE